MENSNLNTLKSPSVTGRVFYLALFVLFGIVLKAQSVISFSDIKKSFGMVKKGEVVKVEFAFTNTGDQPLLISEAKVECSCTSVEFPKQPIAPKQSGVVLVIFDTKSVYDRQDRIVEIISNAKNSVQKIRFKGVVLK